MALSDRIKLVLKENNLSQYELAKRMGTSQATIAFWCTGRTKNLRGDYAAKLSRLFGYDAGWLANGIGLPRPFYSGQEALSPAEIGTKKIPLIEFKDIGKPINTMLSQYLLTDMKISDNAFAVAIKDSSMMPKFEVGDRVIIDPEVPPIPGDFVIVKIDNNEPIFRKIRELGPDSSGKLQYEFVPLNDDYSTISSERHQFEIIGTMLEHRKYRKL